MKEFEKAILIELMESSGIDADHLLSLNPKDSCEFTGAGYLLTLKNPSYPVERTVLSNPDIRGALSGIDVGFTAFIENAEIKLECFTYESELFPAHRNGKFVRNSMIQERSTKFLLGLFLVGWGLTFLFSHLGTAGGGIDIFELLMLVIGGLTGLSTTALGLWLAVTSLASKSCFLKPGIFNSFWLPLLLGSIPILYIIWMNLSV